MPPCPLSRGAINSTPLECGSGHSPALRLLSQVAQLPLPRELDSPLSGQPAEVGLQYGECSWMEEILHPPPPSLPGAPAGWQIGWRPPPHPPSPHAMPLLSSVCMCVFAVGLLLFIPRNATPVGRHQPGCSLSSLSPQKVMCQSQLVTGCCRKSKEICITLSVSSDSVCRSL